MIELPACVSKEIRVDGNRARQLLDPPRSATLEASGTELTFRLEDGSSLPVLRGPSALEPGARGIYAPKAIREDPGRLGEEGALKWIGVLTPRSASEVTESLEGRFSFQLGDEQAGIPGLRLPQLGAVHAVLGHWTIAEAQPGTVVMPTGTGKTETMVSLFAAAGIERLIVIVPSDTLRVQIAEKFETLGVLQRFGVIDGAALRPVVGRVGHRFESGESARNFARACNVVIATPQALFASAPEVTEAFLDEFTHLFVDEAHHVEAATWRHIRDEFSGKAVVQFTATPFRKDGRQMVGRIVYTFPLRQAQAEGYFATINYIPVSEFDEPDRLIAERAITVLREDREAGLDHLVMARAQRIGRARELQELYAELAPDLEPVLLHSSLNRSQRSEALAAIENRASKVIVCVDMLGEGFDLPALKIAALHDPHKSIGITLQFIGRFARVGEEIGDATVVVGRPEGDYDDNLRRLYAEDADWNLLVKDLSAAAVGEQEEVSQFESSFGSLPENVSLRNLAPKMSTIAFRTATTSWSPQEITKLYEEEDLYTLPIGINEHNHVAWFVVEAKAPVGWGDLEAIADLTYHLYVLYWDDASQLLYINSSNKGATHDALARAVCGESAKRIHGEDVYRVMTGIDRLVPVNVGVLDVRNHARRFSMHVGADVIEGFPIAEAQTKTKTNIFAHGYEAGERVTIGAAVKKGRIWSYRIAPTLHHWVSWCDHVGAKVADEGISTEVVMEGFIRPESLEERPALIALAAEWSWEILLNTSEELRLSRGGVEWPLIDTDLRIAEFAPTGPIVFEVSSPDWAVRYEAWISQGETVYSPVAEELLVVTRRGEMSLSEFLGESGLTFFLEDDTTLVPPAILLKPPRDVPAFSDQGLQVLDWSGVDLRKESQGPGRELDSIQARVIAHLLDSQAWRVVIDDDSKGEIADIVAIRVEEEELVVTLVHCKYSSKATPGARLADLYEVCGQAQKSARRRRNVPLFFRQLIRRERARVKRHDYSGFQHGDGSELYALQDEARLLRARFEMLIAQPGLSKAAISVEQRELLGATEVYLRETALSPLTVLCSA